MIVPKGSGKTKRIVRDRSGPYQGDRLAKAMPWVRRGVAVDAGAHIGLWAVQLAPVFAKVFCFEPNPVAFAALEANTAEFENVERFQVGLGRVEVQAHLVVQDLGSHVVDAGEKAETVEVAMRTLDSFAITQVDFLKIDTEGFEPFVVEGGRETIMRSKPVIVIEQKHARYGRKTMAAVDMLQSWGARIEWCMKNDYCLRWRNA